MNAQHITNRLREILEDAGLHVRSEHHSASLRVEFTTSPPLTWTFQQCDRATETILDSPYARPDKFGCHPQGERIGTIGDLFSTNHDRTHNYWDFRLETYDLDPDLAPHAGRSLLTNP